nr:MAG TPA: hypothetical protein [Caudoviricetes sp.]
MEIYLWRYCCRTSSFLRKILFWNYSKSPE